MERPNAWKEYKKTELKKVEQTGEAYKRFLDNGKEEILSEKSAVTYWELEKGDTCVAYVRTGLFGLQFITYMKLYTPPLELDDDFERIGD